MNFEELKNTLKQQEMDKFFEQRTNDHITAVQRYCKAVEDDDNLRFKGLTELGLLHDQTKYSNDEIMPYTYYTWKRKCKDVGEEFTEDPAMEVAFGEAWKHHYTHNKHHPEHYEDLEKMKDLHLAEMVADWFAVGEEFGNGARAWADEKIGSRFKFNEQQVDLIYQIIDTLENLPKEETNEY